MRFSENVATNAPADDRVTVACRSTLCLLVRSWIVTVAGSSTSRGTDRLGQRTMSRKRRSASKSPIETTGGWLMMVTVASDPATVAKSEAATARQWIVEPLGRPLATASNGVGTTLTPSVSGVLLD